MMIKNINWKKRVLALILWMKVFQMNAQVPSISYTTPTVFYVGETSPLLEPINSGGVAYPKVIVSTFAGFGRLGSNDGIGAIATFHFPTGITVDTNDNLHLDDYHNTIIRKIDEFGMVITFAGTGSASSTDGLPTEASFNRLATISIDGNDHLFLTYESKHTIRKITPDGMTSTYAGTGTIGSIDGTALSASFYRPTGLVVDGMVIYVSDYQNHKTRKIDRCGYSISPTLINGFVFDEATGTIS